MKKIIVIAMLIIGFNASVFAGNQAMMNGCMGCHGKTFEKKALGKSKVVKDMSVEDIATAIQGYKDGTYGGPMKGVMIGQAKKMPDAKRAAKHIYMVAHGKSADWKYSKNDQHGKPTPAQFAKKKAKCISKLAAINKCVDAVGDDMAKMKVCKKMIIKLGQEASGEKPTKNKNPKKCSK